MQLADYRQSDVGIEAECTLEARSVSGLIVTEKRAGKVFSTEETKTWKNDPDLVEPKTKDTYSPLIERGRYNCRHWIDYISQETADYLNQNP